MTMVGLQPFGRVAQHARLHAFAEQWGKMPFATDYWFWPHPDIITASIQPLLIDNGWTSNGTLTVVNGSGADFGSSSDFGVPAYLDLDAAGDYLMSPPLFGGYETMYFMENFLGHVPTRLTAEFFAAFLTASNDENTSNIGFVEDGGTITTQADTLACIYSDGTNFYLQSGADSDQGAAIDTNWHRWKIVIERGQSVTWFIDGSLQGGIDLEADEFPAQFGGGVGTSNDIAWGATHIWYE